MCLNICAYSCAHPLEHRVRFAHYQLRSSRTRTLLLLYEFGGFELAVRSPIRCCEVPSFNCAASVTYHILQVHSTVVAGIGPRLTAMAGTDAEVGVARRRSVLSLVLLVFLALNVMPVLSQSVGSQTGPVSFLENYESQSDAQHFHVLDNGQQVQLVLDEYSASGFGSKYQYLFGKIGMRMKLVPGNSAGTVTAYYMSSQTPGLHDEMDFEFLGNVSGEPYILQTNVYANGEGNREQRIYLWFDPTADFHSYSVLWNKQQIIFYVDSTPIRVYKNNKDIGVPYPDSKPVGIYSTIWNGENWATNDGWTKLNWTYAPFIATYESFAVDACLVQNSDTTSCIAQTNSWWAQSEYQTLGAHQVNELEWVRKNYLLYDYCADRKRIPTVPLECARNPL